MVDACDNDVASRRLRVLLVSANFRPSVGGIERFTELLAEGLAHRGHRATVLACRSGGAPREEALNGVRVVRVPASEIFRRRAGVAYPLPAPLRIVQRLRALLREADVVHVQDALYLSSVAALVLARRLRVPSVLTQHAGFVPQASGALDMAEGGAVRTLGRCSRLADLIAAYNPAVAEWARGAWGVDVRIVPVGVPDRPPADLDRASLRRSFGLPEDRFLALFVGRDVPTKGLDLFLSTGSENVELVAVTDGAKSGGKGTHILPFMPPERLSTLLRSVDAFCLPSESEGFPFALQEALVAGLPCVLTRVPGYERFLGPEEALFVAREADAIRDALADLAADGDARTTLAARSRDAGLREFGLENMLRAYEEIYTEAIELRRPGRARAWGRDPTSAPL